MATKTQLTQKQETVNALISLMIASTADVITAKEAAHLLAPTYVVSATTTRRYLKAMLKTGEVTEDTQGVFSIVRPVEEVKEEHKPDLSLKSVKGVIKEITAILDDGKCAKLIEKWTGSEEASFRIGDRETIQTIEKRWTMAEEAEMTLEYAKVETYDVDAELAIRKKADAKKKTRKAPPKKGNAKKTAPKKGNTKPKKDPAPKKIRYTRANALAETFKTKDGGSREELAEWSNALYSKKGGKDNIKESRWYLNNSIGLLADLGVIHIVHSEDGEKIFFKVIVN